MFPVPFRVNPQNMLEVYGDAFVQKRRCFAYLISPPKMDGFMEHALKYNWIIPSQSAGDKVKSRRIDCSIEHIPFLGFSEVGLRKEVWSVQPSIDPALTLPIFSF